MRRYCAGELARKFDVTPGCILRIAHEAGVTRFWCCEERFGYRELDRHREMCPGFAAEIEFETFSDIMSHFEEAWGCTH